MSLVNLFNTPIGRNGLNVFSFNNMENHRVIRAAVMVQKSLTLPIFPLDPMPLVDLVTWLQLHQQIHNAQNAVLDIAGSDLTSVDFSKPEESGDWIWIHAQEHQQACNLLGVF